MKAESSSIFYEIDRRMCIIDAMGDPALNRLIGLAQVISKPQWINIQSPITPIGMLNLKQVPRRAAKTLCR